MQNRKFKMHPQYFLFMVFSAIGGSISVFLGANAENSKPAAIGGFLLLVAVILFGMQMVPIPRLSEKVISEVDQLFPAEAKKKVLILLTNGFTDYKNDGMYLAMLKFSKGDIQRLKRISHVLNGQDDFRDAYPLLEHVNQKLDEHELQ